MGCKSTSEHIAQIYALIAQLAQNQASLSRDVSDVEDTCAELDSIQSVIINDLIGMMEHTDYFEDEDSQQQEQPYVPDELILSCQKADSDPYFWGDITFFGKMFVDGEYVDLYYFKKD